ncbi:hypothetical protein [Accumulibacter sp.]|uniref:hypothetical protein n=1 Tax=Accumulibacter sp. TaxID=2053492 RepID=UPI002580946D|nr:hypothetical protein [Accumulibacter sp.]
MKPPDEMPDTEIWAGSILTPATTSSSDGAAVAPCTTASMAAAAVVRKCGLLLLIEYRDIMFLPFVFASKTHDA